MQMDSVSTTPVLTPDLPAYVADLAARVDRLEQRNRSQHSREHVHASVSGPHSHHWGHGKSYSPPPSAECNSSAGCHNHCRGYCLAAA